MEIEINRMPFVAGAGKYAKRLGQRATRERVRIDPGIGTFAHTDDSGPYITIDPSMLVREHDVWVVA